MVLIVSIGCSIAFGINSIDNFSTLGHKSLSVNAPNVDFMKDFTIVDIKLLSSKLNAMSIGVVIGDSKLALLCLARNLLKGTFAMFTL